MGIWCRENDMYSAQVLEQSEFPDTVNTKDVSLSKMWRLGHIETSCAFQKSPILHTQESLS